MTMDSHPTPPLKTSDPIARALSDAKYDLQWAQKQARDRAIHLVWLYAMAVGAIIGVTIEHFTRFW